LLKREARRAYYSLSIDYNFVSLFWGGSPKETEESPVFSLRKRDGQSAMGAIPVQRLNTGIALSLSYV